MEQFKIRASACGKIMGASGLTEKQLSDIDSLSAKEKKTANQIEKLKSLIYKRDNPELPEGAKTYCKDWLKGKIYNRKREISSKYIEKGLIMEDNSLDYIADQLGFGMLIKNERFYNDNPFMCGTPDIVLKDLVIDVKNSWDCFTFPLFDTDVQNTDYYYQAQVYMELTGINDYKLVYVLSDTPNHLIEKEAYWYAKNNGYDEPDEEMIAAFYKKMTYPDVADKYKIKSFDIKKDTETIMAIQKRVIQCREYINQLIQNLK